MNRAQRVLARIDELEAGDTQIKLVRKLTDKELDQLANNFNITVHCNDVTLILTVEAVDALVINKVKEQLKDYGAYSE